MTAYQLIEGSRQLNTKTNIAEEGNFVIQKLNWVLANTKSVTIPTHGTSNTLTINKYDGNIVSIRLNNGKIEVKESENENMFTPITTTNVTVNYMQFTYIPNIHSAPPGIHIVTQINDQTFTITKYLHQ